MVEIKGMFFIISVIDYGKGSSSVVQAIPTYSIGVFLLPLASCEEQERMI
jgi:hypothetical protein